MSAFRLEKWYMDATDAEGQAIVCYSARLNWKQINLNYNGFTFLPADRANRKVIKRNSFSTGFPLQNAGNSLAWKIFEVEARWQSEASSIEEILLENHEGKILWTCLFPTANANIKVGGESFFQAKGYVEKITLTIPPWKIPIHQLQWGRFISESHYIIWIKWIGPVPRNLVFHNGEKFEDVSISEFQIAFGKSVLILNESRTLRKGMVLSTVFSKFPAITKLFPSSIMSLKENKWCSVGLLSEENTIVERGRAIHELVVWAD